MYMNIDENELYVVGLYLDKLYVGDLYIQKLYVDELCEDRRYEYKPLDILECTTIYVEDLYVDISLCRHACT